MPEFISINPYSGKLNRKFDFISNDQLLKELQVAHQAQLEWQQRPVSARAIPVLKLAELIRLHQDELARTAVREMGKPIKEAVAEVLKCTTACAYYASESERLLQPTFTQADTGKQVETRFEPMGIVLGIFPWNFPYWQIIRSMIPVVMSGNALLVKPAPNVPECSLFLQRLVEEAGFPKGVVQTLFADEQQIANLIKHPLIKACTLTGSETAGAAVASQAATVIKKSVLELGGSDPFIVLDNADLDLAAETAITARFQNNGQSCIASKRFILHEKIAEPFTHKFVERITALRMGDPMDPSIQIGPLARKDLMEKLKNQVDETVKAGAAVIFQHWAEPGHGYFFPPTVLTNIPESSPAYREELFGPVVSIFKAPSDEACLRIANDTSFGLGASVWTADPERATRFAQQLECGQVFVNGLVKSHTAFPFGGVKHSGFGRELGENGLREFCTTKTIWR